jgi:hypothetical protein
MARSRVNVLEDLDYAVSKKRRDFERKPKDQRYREVEGLLGVAEEPPRANVLHIGNRLPQETKSKNSDLDNKGILKKTGNKNPYSAKDDLAHWVDDDGKMLNAVAEVLDKASEEKELVKLEKEIAGFSPAEQKFIDPMIDINIYRKEFLEAKNRIEGNGTLKRGWEEAIKESYIVKRLGWSNDRQLAPEKKAILREYLELKLPVGIPEEKKEKSFTPEQSSELLQWIGLISRRFKEWVKKSEQWEPEFGDEETKKRAIFDKIRKEINDVISSDLDMKKLFSEQEIPRAAEHVMKFVEKFNFDLKK